MAASAGVCLGWRGSGRRAGRLSAPILVLLILALLTPPPARAAGQARSTWTQALSTTPSARYWSTMAYDAGAGKLLLFGGSAFGPGQMSNTWTWDGAGWVRQHPSQSPPPRYEAAMAYDPATQSIVLFGGESQNVTAGQLPYFNDTWIWHAGTWHQASTSVAPPARFGPSLAYDPNTHTILLFGGFGGDGFLSDTWEWNGTTWKQVGGATVTPGRYGASMAADSASGDVVLFGGLGGSGTGTMQDTWLWNGSAWNQAATLTSPPSREYAGLAPDPSGHLVLFGGYQDSGVRYTTQTLGDTWVWNGGSWIQQQPISAPPARYGGAMAYDATLQRTVLFSGCCNSSGGFFDDTWAWDGSTWQRRDRTTAPYDRFGSNMIYDSAARADVLFGGFGGDGFLGDTWTTDGRSWTQVDAGSSPPGRANAAMTYDEARNQVVVFGGQGSGEISCATPDNFPNNNHLCNDTWTWSNGTWTKQATLNAPGKRSLASMAYDLATQTSVLYGGFANLNDLGDTWTWDGSAWTQQNPASSPGPRETYAMAYDPATRTMVLFGGEGTAPDGSLAIFNDTWTWNGVTWTQQHPKSSPSARRAASMIYDPTSRSLVLYGGSDANGNNLSDIWRRDGKTWTSLGSKGSPPPRSFAALAYAPATGSAILFGGYGQDGILSDEWLYRLQ